MSFTLINHKFCDISTFMDMMVLLINQLSSKQSNLS